MKKLNSWFEIDEQQYIWYILQGYEIYINEYRVAWRLNGLWHREDGPAYIGADGTQDWYLNGQRHREDGPAYIKADGRQEWWLNGQRHREDGPAVIWPDGRQEWVLNGQEHTERDFNEKIKLVV